MSMQRISLLALLAVAAAAVSCAPRAPAIAPGPSGTPAAVVAGVIDYANPAHWLCLPGREDACKVDLSATVIAADGSMTHEEWQPHPNPPIDCFYVYPTVSQEPTANSGIVPTAAERAVIASQFARFGSECRLFAPMYRQMTLAGLRANLAGGDQAVEADEPLEIAYGDVREAWNSYLERENNGRGVVLIGHSQGSIMLLRLLQEEIDTWPIQPRIVSALLIGWNVLVPEDRDVGGDLEAMPLCRSRTQIECIVTYVSFSEDQPPPPNALFGRSAVPGLKAGCTNPAALGGGRSELDSYLAANRGALPPWVSPERPVTTNFVKVPGMLFGECVFNANGSYLSISVQDHPGPRSSDIGGNVMNPDGTPNAMWGLHLLDMPLGIGNLVDLVDSQARAYQSRPR
jgi:hypothetical protein